MPANPLGNKNLIRALNRSTVLNMIKTFGPISRAEIARRTRLSPATVTYITAALIRDSLVFEKTAGDSSGGRPPILLALNPQGGYVVGIKLMEDHASGALTNLEASLVNKSTYTLTGRDPDMVSRDLANLVGALLHKSQIHRKQLLGVGIGLAGIVDASKGILRQSPTFGWQDVPLQEMLEKLLRVPVTIDNDVNTLTLTERWFGSGQQVDHFLTVTVGRGIGMGIVVNGQFYRGARGGAGEFGHSVVDPDGPLCACGKRGCLEAYAGDPGLLRAAQIAAQEGRISRPIERIEELVELAQAGDPCALEIYATAGRLLGQGIANLINVFNPQKIIICGEGVRAGDFLFKPMLQSIRQNALPGLYADVSISIDPWGDDAWALGAASLVLRRLFESPVHRDGELA